MRDCWFVSIKLIDKGETNLASSWFLTLLKSLITLLQPLFQVDFSDFLVRRRNTSWFSTVNAADARY